MLSTVVGYISHLWSIRALSCVFLKYVAFQGLTSIREWRYFERLSEHSLLMRHHSLLFSKNSPTARVITHSCFPRRALLFTPLAPCAGFVTNFRNCLHMSGWGETIYFQLFTFLSPINLRAKCSGSCVVLYERQLHGRKMKNVCLCKNSHSNIIPILLIE